MLKKLLVPDNDPRILGGTQEALFAGKLKIVLLLKTCR